LDWLWLLPDVVRDAAACQGHPLAFGIARWDGVCQRLGLTIAERVVGAALLAQEIDESVHAHIMGERAGLGCARSDVLQFVRSSAGVDVLAGLVGLEQRGIAVVSEAVAGVWAGAPVALAPAVRAQCLGVLDRAPAHDAVSLLPRLDAAVRDAVAACERVGAASAHVIVRGRPGSGRDSALAVLLGGVGAHEYRCTPLQLRDGGDRLEPELSGRAAVWDARAFSKSPEDTARGAAFLARSATACVSLLDSADDAPIVQGRAVAVVDADPVDRDERQAGWERALAGRAPASIAAAVADGLGAATRAGVGLAHRAARAVAAPRVADIPHWTRAVRHQLEAAVQPSDVRGVVVERPEISLDRLVCAAQTKELIVQMLAMMRHAVALSSASRAGAKALFSGPPGTGKTLASRCLAFEAGLPLYRVDLATVVSKWVGETEKNLRDAMQAAEAVGAVLLFDEGDALFGARGDVERGSDRYANMEVSYLLQALEAFDGTVIVTTNLRTNIDRAFQRRFDFVVDFRDPDAELRLALWRQEIGEADTAVSDELLADIARQAELSGGHIAVATRVARALALDADRPLHDDDLVRALAAELRKLGGNVAASRWDKTRANGG
jgi:AAA+ superfamily predicted ATPase